MNKIQTTYFESSYDIHHYSCIWKNRIVKINNNVTNTTILLHNKIRKDPVFKYICTLATMNGHGNDKDNKMTNTFINGILQQNKPYVNLQPIMESVNHDTDLLTVVPLILMTYILDNY